MFKEILKILPRLDNSDMNKMDRNLSQRFAKISKKFGKGLAAGLAGGGLLGLAAGVIEKILNPLKETQEAIDKILKQSDDVVTNANQFGTTAGKLFKLASLAKTAGLDEDSLYMLINKFQNTVAEAKADPKKQTSVRNFVGIKDGADAFFAFMQGLKELQGKDPSKALLVQQEVFGEKQTLKMAEFLQLDFAKKFQEIGARPSEAYTPGLEKLAGLSDMTDALEVKRNMKDMLTKSRLINTGVISSRDRQVKQELSRENEKIATYQSLATISIASAKITALLEKGLLTLTDMGVKMSNMNSIVNKIPTFRGLKGFFSGKGE
jgi:hypothetical protein